MAQQIINIGGTPNDGTGTPWRQAWGWVNDMFTEIYTALGSFASSSALTAEASTRANDDATLATAIAGKANADSVAGKADATSVIPRNAALAITNAERAQHAVNSGQMVAMAFPIFHDSTTPTTDTFKLPPLPANFYLIEVDIVIHRCEGVEMTAQLVSLPSATTVASVNGGLTSANEIDGTYANKLSMIINNPRVITPLGGIEFIISAYAPSYLAADSFGMTLWLRGVWGQ